VRLEGIREPARVRRLLSNDRLEVDAGFMKMQVSVDDVLEVLPEAAGSGKLPKNSASSLRQSWRLCIRRST
jgi:DNA mismatch repair protein MutS2